MGLPPDLQSQLASITAGLPGGSGASRREYISLNDTLTRDVLNRVLEMPGIGERLRPGLPENWGTDDTSVAEVIQSPQFQQVAFVIYAYSRRLSPRFLRPFRLGNLLLYCSNLD